MTSVVFVSRPLQAPHQTNSGGPGSLTLFGALKNCEFGFLEVYRRKSRFLPRGRGRGAHPGGGRVIEAVMAGASLKSRFRLRQSDRRVTRVSMRNRLAFYRRSEAVCCGLSLLGYVVASYCHQS